MFHLVIFLENILSDYNNKTNEYTYNLGHGYDDIKILHEPFMVRNKKISKNLLKSLIIIKVRKILKQKIPKQKQLEYINCL